jgi:hypothetical protein
MNLIIIGVSILLVILIIYFFIITYPKYTPQVLNRGPYALSGGIQVIGNSDLGKFPNEFLTSGQGAFQCFVYLDGNVRTGNASDCGTDPAVPSCNTGTYQECPCDTDVSCSNCAHSGYKKLINLYDTFHIEILTMPDASRQRSVSSQITVKTSPTQTTYAVETFPLPPLPEQKWTMITISKQGRQIYVYYNNILVLSKKALHTFSITPPGSQIPVFGGDVNLSGTLAMATFFPNFQSISDVESRYSQMVDTRGNLNTMPVVPTSSSYAINDTGASFWGNVYKFFCLDGSCFSTSQRPVIVPTIPSIYSPMQTSYA